MLEFTRISQNCEGRSRRTFLQVGGLSLFGLSLPKILAAEQATNRKARSTPVQNCILLWTDGGLANMDTLDLKPDAPIEYRGEFRGIESSLPGAPVCEHLPLMARQMHRVCQLRTIEHSGSQHAEASHFMLTGYPQIPDVNAAPVGSTVYPSIGSVVARELSWRHAMPPYVQISGGGIQYSGAGYLGSAWNPLLVRSDPNAADFAVEDVSIPAAIGPQRMDRRRRMLDRLDAWQREADRSSGGVFDRAQFYQQAYDLITSPGAKKAFQIEDESAAVRESYGRNREGQATLLARRLVEAGVRFVTVQFSGYDTHDNNFGRLKNQLLPTLDRAWSALLNDLGDRGLLENTLVVCASEFGRTPKVNGAAGRDHYPLCNVISFSGAGVKTGSITGQTDARCERVVGRSNTTLDYAATMFRLLGIDDTQEYTSDDGRPIQINNGGVAIEEMLTV